MTTYPYSYILLISSIVPSLHGQLQDCIFTDTNSGEAQLDLTSLNEFEMYYYDGTKYNYSYSVCANNLHCKPAPTPETFVMVAQYEPDNPSFPGECWWLAEWNNTNIQQPYYDQTSEKWLFPAFIGMGCVFDNEVINRITSLYWQCNAEVETAKIVSLSETANCTYEMTVQSQYACPDMPPPYCQWYGSNGALLDLKLYDTTTITAIDNEQSQFIFAYTPCRNGVECIELDVMAKLENITSSVCESYLAVWEEDNRDNVVPNYDENNKVWEFHYTNGEPCESELPSEFFVYWFCNPDIRAPQYNVKQALLVAPCLYELQIESNVAC